MTDTTFHVSLQRQPLGQNRYGGLQIAMPQGGYIPVFNSYRLFKAILAGEPWHDISALDPFASFLERQDKDWLMARVGRPFTVDAETADYLTLLLDLNKTRHQRKEGD